jgi:hypothetical protein
MEWLSFFGHRRPINGQKIYYYGKHIGVWRGRYEIHWNDPVSPHIIFCEEEVDMPDDIIDVIKVLRCSTGLNLKESKEKVEKISTGVVDRMDAPWWQPYEGQPKPQKPIDDYPPDYPS